MQIEDGWLTEPERRIPVAKQADVLVIGGSPTGVAAAVAAARNGADVLLVERYGILGGQTTAGLVFTHGKRLLYDARGRKIVAGINWEMIARTLDQGGAEPAWKDDLDWEWYGTWLDPEILKLVLMEMVTDAGVRLLLHSLVVSALLVDGQMRGVVVENKSGRQALLGRVTIDASGDADVAALAGAPFDTRAKQGFAPGLHSIFGQVDIHEVLHYLEQHPEQYAGLPVTAVPELRERTAKGWSWGITGFKEFVAKAIEDGTLREGDARRDRGLGFLWMRDGTVQVWSIQPETAVSALDVDDLTVAELQVRQRLNRIRCFFRDYVPGFGSAVLLATPAQIGIRETRRIRGEYVLTREDVHGSVRFPDSVALCAGHDEADKVQTGFGIPYRCLLPVGVDNLLVAGRCISADAPTALNAVRGIIGGVSTGEAAGTAAALAVQSGVTPREVDVTKLQETLRRQGVILD